MRGRTCFGSCLAAVVQIVSFVQAFAGAAVALYAVFALQRWARRGGALDLQYLSEIWFPVVVMGAGMTICLLAIIGYAAAEKRSGCCLGFYSLLAIFLLLLEATLAGDLIFNKHWQKDLPDDHTGELINVQNFVRNNLHVCRWLAAGFVSAQALLLFWAMTSRAMASTRRVNSDSDEEYIVIRSPLLVAQVAPGPGYAPSTFDDRGPNYDFWSSQMRQKYGLNKAEVV